ncbi:MAG: DNA alkylation repair protein [Myxococcales bacterium]|nr:DNA alkylation repair protein [Myxococcales bacterium]
MISSKKVKEALAAKASAKKAKASAWFFKTGPGEYAEGDRFLGVTVPDQRKVARTYRDLSLGEATKLLRSPIHEHRLTAVFILIDQFARGEDAVREKIYQLCVANLQHLNDWDLIDAAAPRIGGPYLVDHRGERKVLPGMVKSSHLWTRRWAIMCTYAFIREGDFAPTLRLTKALLRDEEDLIHKAAGWMLREVGNRDRQAEKVFLDAHAHLMPRTMLRYAIEKFPEGERKTYLRKGKARGKGE